MAKKDNPVIGTETCFEVDCRREMEVRVNKHGRCYSYCDGAASEDGDGCTEHHRWNMSRSRKMKVQCGYPADLKGGVDGA